MTREHIGRIAGVAPLACSAFAFAIVIANVALRVPAQPDEGASAHMWQLLIAVQLPLIAVFVVTADWHRPKASVLLGAQLLALTAACVPVFLAGY